MLSSSIFHTSTSTSDHYPIVSSLNITPNPLPPSTTFRYRRIKSIYLSALIFDLATSQLIINSSTTIPELLSPFYDTVRSLLDKHVPLITKTTSRLRFNPLMTSDILLLKAHRRKLERIYIQSYSPIYFFKLRSASNKYHKLITSTKRSFDSNLILKSASKSRLLWKTITSLLYRFPTCSPYSTTQSLSLTAVCHILFRQSIQTSS